MGRKMSVVLLCVLMALGLILRLHGLSRRSLWTDEFFTLFQATGHGLDALRYLQELSQKKPPEALRAGGLKRFLRDDPARGIKDVSNSVLVTDTHPPLYFWLMHFWMRAFGESALVLRSFSVLMGVLCIWAAYCAGRVLFGNKAAVFSAVFTCISPFAVMYAREARSYSLILLLALLSVMFLARFDRKRRALDAVGFAAVNSLGIYTHYFYIFVSLAQFFYFSVAHRLDAPLLRKFYLAFICSLLLFSPWYLRVMERGYNFYLTEWLFGFPGFMNKLYYLAAGFIRYVAIYAAGNPLSSVPMLAAVALFIYMGWRTPREALKSWRRELLFCVALTGLPLAGMCCMDYALHGAVLRQERFWTFSFAGFILLAGYFLSHNFSRHKAVMYLFMLCLVISAANASGIQFGPAPERVSEWINREAKGLPSAVIVYNVRSVVFAQAYYLDDNVYVVPVSDEAQLTAAVSGLSDRAVKIFVVRHYHPTDNALMNQLFMETKDLGPGYRFEEARNSGYISVNEFVKR